MVTPVETSSRAVLGAVVIAAISWEKLRAAFRASNRASATTPVAPGAVMCRVAGAVRQFEILKAVVGFVLVLVMYDFSVQQCAAEMVAHHKSVLGNIAHVSRFQGIWVFRPQQVDVTVCGHKAPASPSRVASASVFMPRSVTDVVSASQPKDGGSTRFEGFTASTFTVDGHAMIIATAQDWRNV